MEEINLYAGSVSLVSYVNENTKLWYVWNRTMYSVYCSKRGFLF